MNKFSKTNCVFLSCCFFIIAPAIVHARFENSGFEEKIVLQDKCLNRIIAKDLMYLLEDANPAILKRLAVEPELKKRYIKEIRHLLALSCQATKENLADENFQREAKNIEVQLTAVNYDKQINKGANQTEPLSRISESRIAEFYADAKNLADFEVFLKSKLELLKNEGQLTDMSNISAGQLRQAKDYYAKTEIYYREAQNKSAELPKEFWGKLNILIKIQQAQLFARDYSQKILESKQKFPMRK